MTSVTSSLYFISRANMIIGNAGQISSVFELTNRFRMSKVSDPVDKVKQTRYIAICGTRVPVFAIHHNHDHSQFHRHALYPDKARMFLGEDVVGEHRHERVNRCPWVKPVCIAQSSTIHPIKDLLFVTHLRLSLLRHITCVTFFVDVQHACRKKGLGQSVTCVQQSGRQYRLRPPLGRLWDSKLQPAANQILPVTHLFSS